MSSYLEKHNFVDIAIYMRTGKNKYLNITDFCLSGDNEYISLNTKSKYVLMFFPFLKQRCICDVNINELMALAGIDQGFVHKFEKQFGDGDGEEYIALICAKKILNYQYGKAVEVNTKMHKKGLLKMSFLGTNFASAVLKELPAYPLFYMTFL